MRENKDARITVRITVTQFHFLQNMVDSGKFSSVAAAIQYLITKQMTLGK